MLPTGDATASTWPDGIVRFTTIWFWIADFAPRGLPDSVFGRESYRRKSLCKQRKLKRDCDEENRAHFRSLRNSVFPEYQSRHGPLNPELVTQVTAPSAIPLNRAESVVRLLAKPVRRRKWGGICASRDSEARIMCSIRKTSMLAGRPAPLCSSSGCVE
jgi:hypothetical protein